MFSGIRIFSADDAWRKILDDLGAVVVDEPAAADVNLDALGIDGAVSPMELKARVLDAMDVGPALVRIFGRRVRLPRMQLQIVMQLYRAGEMTGADLRAAIGVAPNVTTHAVDNAIYQLRKTFGRDFIQNRGGVYSLGKL
ncbi:MAG: hypothetical protein K2L94_03365 [Alphaproteobacteria bacterium]|nr:hypothetical protein [Alphaproteobacteria bacterium]